MERGKIPRVWYRITDKITYYDWFGARITQSVDDLIWQIRKLEETETRLKERLVKLGEITF